MLLAAMLGAFSGGTITLANQAVTDENGIAAGISYNNDGGITGTTPLGTDPLGEWITPTAYAPGAYEIRATLESGTLSGGTVDEWLALTTDRGWSVSAGNAAVLTIEIRLGGVVLDDCTVTLTAV